jgi:hypothetical protein
MSITSTNSTTQLAFSMSENPGVYAVLLGSGVSRSAGIPTGWEITLELIRRAGIAAGAGERLRNAHLISTVCTRCIASGRPYAGI